MTRMRNNREERVIFVRRSTVESIEGFEEIERLSAVEDERKEGLTGGLLHDAILQVLSMCFHCSSQLESIRLPRLPCRSYLQSFFSLTFFFFLFFPSRSAALNIFSVNGCGADRPWPCCLVTEEDVACTNRRLRSGHCVITGDTERYQNTNYLNITSPGLRITCSVKTHTHKTNWANYSLEGNKPVQVVTETPLVEKIILLRGRNVAWIISG